MNQVISLLKENLWDKKWIILIMGGLIGLLGFGIILLLGTMDMTSIQSVLETFPSGFLDFFGDSLAAISTPYGFFSLEFLNFIWLYAGIFMVYIASSLLSQEVEEKTIDLALTKPIKRYQFLGSKIYFLAVFIGAILGVTFLLVTLGVLTSPTFLEYGMYLDRLWATYLITTLFLMALSMITFLFSTIFLKSKKSLAFGIAVFFTMYFITSFAPYMQDAELIKFISIFTYFNPTQYLVHANGFVFFRDLIIMSSVNTALIIGSLLIFNKKDIPN
ncbi:MAG: hypothetical protein EAX96_17205 [Candidatus Lokiarchaeota archaeon]|nr:hypothetical protein [Candidatus Lokiarchaeota archaeon]